MGRVLELRPNCECCDRDLPPGSTDAMICTFECTWCRDCVDTVLGGRCPNCSGNLVPRPIRPAGLLAANPASTTRVLSELAECVARRPAAHLSGEQPGA
ncbi:MAG: hypothetical protein JWO11_3280 [Nocardioides sp.]|nr:hypothetical protein [Nocardioides sp.]